MFTVYILYSQRIDKHYIGYSSNLQDRILKHNRSSKGFTASGKPWTLVYSEVYNDKKSAMGREIQLKKWKNRKLIETLIKEEAEGRPADAGSTPITNEPR